MVQTDQAKMAGTSDMKIKNIPVDLSDRQVDSQLEVLRKKNIIRVGMVGNKAYWVHDNIFYESDVVNGYIDNMAARPVDAYNLTGNQLRRLLEILDNIS